MGGNESVEVTAGIWGFLVFFGLAVACWFLFRSMNNHLRRVSFTERAQTAHEDTPDPRDEGDPIGAPRP